MGLRLGLGSPFLLEQVGESALRADVVVFPGCKFFFGLYGRCDGHEAVEATSVVTSILVLCAVVHSSSLRIGRCYALARLASVTGVTDCCEIAPDLNFVLWGGVMCWLRAGW